MSFSYIGESAAPLNEIGGKAFNLNLLKKEKINIPAGMILHAENYYSYLETKEISKELSQEIKRFIDSLECTHVMVRSSAVGEDGKDFSFAGLLESFITKKQLEEVLKNIILCWKSIENQRVTTYNEQNKQALGGVAVVIQRMIEPEFAGVYFTQSPIDENSCLVEYVQGHAEKLVQGEVDPESISFPKDEIPERDDLPLAELIKITQKILTIYNDEEQDIEWVYDGKNYHIVQSRPITTIKTKTQWSNTNVNENYPEKLSPLLYSIARRSYYHYFKNLSLKLGILKKTQQFDQYFYNIIGIWGHKMFYNMSSIHNVIDLAPVKSIFKSSFDDFVGYQNSKKKVKVKNWWKLGLLLFNVFTHLLLLPRKVKFIENLVDAYASKEVSASKNKHSGLFHEFLNIRFNLWENASFADLFAMLFHGFLGKICKEIDEDKAQGYQNGLIQAIPDLVSNKPILKVWNISEEIKKESLVSWFNENEADLIWKELRHKNNKIFILINDYLNEIGFRCSGELTFFLDNYLERPESFIEMLKLYLQNEQRNPKEIFKKNHEAQKVLSKEISQKTKEVFKNPVKAFCYNLILKATIKLTMYSISCRERVRLKQAKLYHHFKSVLLKISEELFVNNLGLESHDIFYLEYDEISRILAGEDMSKDYIRDLVSLRKKRLEKSEDIEFDNFYTFDHGLELQTYSSEPQGSKDGSLVGLPACAGVIKAPVKVLKSIHEIEKLEQGDILVTSQTDPGWVYAFPLISGLIVERGGMLSHGAIVAREFGIPAVVGIKKVTELLEDGQIVEIDGTNGVVRC